MTADRDRPRSLDRPRRSLHFVPGANERLLQKSLESAADALVLDLEDALTPARKADGRETIARWLESVDFRGKERVVRMNPLDTPWGLEDLRATMTHPPDLYLVPKVSTLADLHRIDAEISRLEAEHGHPPGHVALLVIATETPLGVLNLTSFPQCSRVIGLSWGAEDLSAALGAPCNRRPDGTYLDLYRYCRIQTLLAAAAGGVQPLDTAYVNIRDPEGLRAECLEASWMGFTGKITVHPDQIDIVNSVFTPSEAELNEAHRLVQAMEAAEAEGLMAIEFEGRMVDVPHLERARKLIARARQIESTDGSS